MRFHVSVSDAITEIAFDDGGMNLLSSAALRELDEVFATIPPHRLVVFRSRQPRLFAAGADMAEMVRFDADDARAFSRLGQEMFARIERFPALTVAIVDGDCFGGALDLILAFDLRLATPRSRFAHPGAKLGIVTGFGGTTRWRNVTTPAFARQMFLANRTFSAAEALEAGLVDGVAESCDAELARLAALDQTGAAKIKSTISSRR